MNPVKKIRILLVGMPTMLLDIVSEVVKSEPDFVVVDATSSVADLASAVKRTQADVVIVQQTSGGEQIGEAELLSMQHPLRVITLTDDGRRGFLDEFRLCRDALGEMSVERLIDTIRASVNKTPQSSRWS